MASSGPRAVADQSSLVQFGGGGGVPSSLRELQASLPAIQQRGTPKKDIRIKQTGLNHDSAVMEIAWYDGNYSNYPYDWLRDNCQCESCFNQHEKKRKTMASMQQEQSPEKAKNLMEGTLLHLTWADGPNGHDSYYTANWLKEHCFERGMKPYERDNYSPAPQLWNENNWCEKMEKMNLFSYDEVMDAGDDSKLLKLLATLQSLGFVKISGAPSGSDEEGSAALENLIARCSPTTAVRVPFNKFQSIDAEFQTSLPYYHHVPGIQLLHCDVPANQSTRFVDGFAVAKQIRQEYPEPDNVFDMLSRLEVSFYDESPGETEAAMKSLRRRLAPTFELDKKNGEVWRVNFNNECRDSATVLMESKEGVSDPVTTLNGSLSLIQDQYFCLRVMNKFLDEFLGRASGFEYHLKQGDVVLVNNWRVLVQHGEGGTLTQGFFDWDEAQSKMNVLSGQHRDLKFLAE